MRDLIQERGHHWVEGIADGQKVKLTCTMRRCAEQSPAEPEACTMGRAQWLWQVSSSQALKI